MSTKIITKNSQTTTSVPTTSDVDVGELAVNTADKRVFTNDGTSVVELGTAPSSLAVTGNTTVGGTLGVTGNVDINGGNIDGTTIGATTAAAGSFTTVSATGNITVGGTVDGRDVAADGTKLDGIEAGADVTDTTNVTAAGALMDSELTNITAVKALNQGVATTDSPTFAGLTTSADINFGDNDKAIFGAGSDLQIYHDGSNSRIKDTGTGALVLQTNQVNILSTTGEQVALFNEDSNVKLYYDNAEKLATTSTGIDVTGTATMDGLTVDKGSDGADIATFTGANTGRKLAIQSFQSGSSVGAGFELNATSLEGAIRIATAGNDRALFSPNGDISFYEDTGTTAKFFWDASAERLGVGTSSPSGKLSVALGTSYSAGNGWTDSTAVFGTGTANGGGLGIAYDDTNGGVIASIIPGVSWKPIEFQSSELVFSTNGASERMRIDSSGNLLVGKTSSNIATVGIELRGDGAATFTNDNAQCVFANRTGSDGAIYELRKDGTTVGSIGVYGARINIGNGDVGIFFDNLTDDAIKPWNISTNAARDAAIDLGENDNRFKDLYLSGGVYLGGTGSANHLDDYEEGTWTPTVAAAGGGAGVPSAYTTSASYTKTGNSVVARFTLIATTGTFTWTALNSYFLLGGLPFQAVNDLNSFAISTGNIASTGAKGVGRTIATSSTAYFWGMESAGGSVTQLSGTVVYQAA